MGEIRIFRCFWADRCSWRASDRVSLQSEVLLKVFSQQLFETYREKRRSRFDEERCPARGVLAGSKDAPIDAFALAVGLDRRLEQLSLSEGVSGKRPVIEKITSAPESAECLRPAVGQMQRGTDALMKK